tara:strand:+ start:735 stop:1571 length:837 start_codon:yes stop_codon:yes gene_type:complete
MKFKFNIRFVVIIIFSLFLINHVVIKPFPFFNVEYVKNKKKFNESPLNELDFYKIKINENSNFNSSLKKEITSKKNDDILKKISYATELTRSIQEKSTGNELKIYENLVSSDEKFNEICSESSKIFSYIMSELGEFTRILWLNGHTITEVWNGDSWIFVDTSSNVYAFDKIKENYVSFLDIIENTSLIEFKTITKKKYKLWDYRESPENLHNIINKNNLIFVISAEKIFNFHQNREKINRITDMFSLDNSNKAKQFTGFKNPYKVGNLGIRIYRLFLV